MDERIQRAEEMILARESRCPTDIAMDMIGGMADTMYENLGDYNLAMDTVINGREGLVGMSLIEMLSWCAEGMLGEDWTALDLVMDAEELLPCTPAM